MAEIVSKDQRIVTGVTNPGSVYSRQVQIVILVPAGVGLSDSIVTPRVGENTWLLGVDVWLFTDALATLIGGLIWVLAGKTKEVDFGGLTTAWESVVDMPTVSAKSLVWYGDTFHFHWDMQRLYASPGYRFALCGQNLTEQRWWGIASFLISEG